MKNFEKLRLTSTLSRTTQTLILGLCALSCSLPAFADNGQAAKDQAQVMQSFERQEQEAEQAKELSEKQKQRIMFFLGVPLLLFILIAVGLGVAMGVYGKQVFVWHMLFAGLSATLAIVHAIVGLVWFYPFR